MVVGIWKEILANENINKIEDGIILDIGRYIPSLCVGQPSLLATSPRANLGLLFW